MWKIEIIAPGVRASGILDDKQADEIIATAEAAGWQWVISRVPARDCPRIARRPENCQPDAKASRG
jgi:hypothetical protein